MSRLSIACLLVLFGVLAGCTSPNPVLYTIAPVPGPVQAGGLKVVVLRQIGLARYLDRSQIVRTSEGYKLEVMANEWWGEPLGAMLSRVLVEELGQRLPATSVYSESGAVSVRPDVTIEVNVQRMDEDAAGNLVLAAQAAIINENRRGPPLTRSFRFVVPPTGPDMTAQVAATSAAVGQLADGLAAMLAGGAGW